MADHQILWILLNNKHALAVSAAPQAAHQHMRRLLSYFESKLPSTNLAALPTLLSSTCLNS